MAIKRNAPQMVDIRQALGDLDKGSDRAVGIVLGAIVEDRLRNVLKARLAKNEKLVSAMLGRMVFAHQIDLGAAIGLYSEQFRKCLHELKEIRNQFAHSIAEHTFDETTIASRINNLKYIADKVLAHWHRPRKPSRREIYISVSQFILGALWSMEMKSRRLRKPPL